MSQGNSYRDMTSEQAEWLEFCKYAYKSHMYNLWWDDGRAVSLLHGAARTDQPDLVCVALGSAPSRSGLVCMAFFDAAGEVVTFVDCVHDAVFEWLTWQDDLSEALGLDVSFNGPFL